MRRCAPGAETGRSALLARGVMILMLLSPLAVRADLETALERLERGDFASALPELRRLAGDGDVRAKGTLAGLYLKGIGVERDVAQAQGGY